MFRQPGFGGFCTGFCLSVTGTWPHCSHSPFPCHNLSRICQTLNWLRFRSRHPLMSYSRWTALFCCLRRRFLLLRYRRVSLRSIHQYRWSRCFPLDPGHRAGFSQTSRNPVRSSTPCRLVYPYQLLVCLWSRRL